MKQKLAEWHRGSLIAILRGSRRTMVAHGPLKLGAEREIVIANEFSRGTASRTPLPRISRETQSRYRRN